MQPTGYTDARPTGRWFILVMKGQWPEDRVALGLNVITGRDSMVRHCMLPLIWDDTA